MQKEARPQKEIRQYYALYAFHLVYFIVNGANTFQSKLYGELGIPDGQIGVLTSVPSLVALALMPLAGTLSDRLPRKRYLLAVGLLLVAASGLWAGQCVSFWPMLLAVCAYTSFAMCIMPVITAISMEHCREIDRPYGPIRLLGTVGYQAGALLVGALLARSLRGLYPLISVVALLSFGITFAMPNVAGHQRREHRVPMRALFADRHVCWLLGLILFATVSSQFYMSFFAKHLGDLGMDNATVAWITTLSVLPELPFLFFADRITRRTSIWNWLLIGMLINGVRWVALALCRDAAPIFIIQITAVSVMACFEFMPAFYLARRVPPELSGSAQTLLTLTTFGAGRVIGSLLGGLICERTGIPAVFAFNGAMLLLGCAAFWKPTRRLIREEAEASR